MYNLILLGSLILVVFGIGCSHTPTEETSQTSCFLSANKKEEICREGNQIHRRPSYLSGSHGIKDV